jgi:hypothetical protein
MCGVVQDWGHPRLVDLNFESFAGFPVAGGSVGIPLNPVSWTMVLMKH